MTKRPLTLAFSLLVALFSACGNDADSSDDSSDYTDTDSTTTRVSRLEMPNAFSPNGDGINDIYKAKSYSDIETFEATIFNRQGVELFSWTDITTGWDGKYNGKDAPDGTYYVVVEALGADDREWNIKRDVNLMRDYVGDGNE